MVMRAVRQELAPEFLAKRQIDRTRGFTPLAVSGVLVPERVAKYEIGQSYKNKGVYVGIWRRPVDRNGIVLNAEFNVFAAPNYTHHLTNTEPNKLATYYEDVKRVAGLRDICGHDGIMLPNDTAIYEAIHEAIRTGDYTAISKWHMPVKELVNGLNIDDGDVQPDNLYAHKDRGALTGTFTGRVWTASGHRNNPHIVCVVDFADDGADNWHHNFSFVCASRSVRLEPL